MKTKTKLSNWIPSGILALILAGSASTAMAQLDVGTFDTDISQQNGGTGGSVPPTTAWDSTGDPGGSEYITVAWPDAIAWHDSQVAFNGSINTALYDKLECDIMVDTANSTLTDSGDYGGLQLIMQNWSGGQGWTVLGGFTVANTPGWQHFEASLASYAGSCDQIVVAFNVNQYGTAPHAGPCAYRLDNVRLTSSVVYPPPTLHHPAPAPQQKGLTLMPATTGQYQRVMVYPNTTTYGTSLGWYNSANFPVTYSIMITNFPNLNNYTAQAFFMPNASMPYGQADSAIDWNITNSLIFTVSANSSNPPTGWGVTMACKTNLPGANPNVTITNFSYGVLPVGEWKITFNNNTDFTITAPDLTQVDGSLTPDQADLVSGNIFGNTAMTPYFGIQNNALNSIGVPAVFGNIQMSNVQTNGQNGIIYDDFTADAGVFNTNAWVKLSDNANDISVNNGLACYVAWTIPGDTGYGPLQAASSPLGPWVDFSAAPSWVLVNGAERTATIATPDLVSMLGETDHTYFRLIKRAFTQLQVILPGETAAPGTPTGKTGTPDVNNYGATGGIQDLVVNAVDANWYPVGNVSDGVTLSSDDTSALLPAAPVAMVNGVATFTSVFAFSTTGTFTITATDSTNGGITPNTSSPVLVQ